MMVTKTRQIKRVDFENALQKLYAIQPKAFAIRRESCHCPQHALLLSYRLPIPADDAAWTAREKELETQGLQTCGFFCAACSFSNAGERKATVVFGDDVP